MSLIRRVALLMLAVVLLALVAGVLTTLLAARDTLQTQLSLKNRDNAQSLALALSQQRGDAVLMEVVLAAQFDTGHYRRIVLRGGDGQMLFERQSESNRSIAPQWFASTLPIQADAGVAQVSDGWRAIGTLDLASQSAYAIDSLWQAGVRASALLALVGVLGAGLAALGLRAIRKPLDAAVEQAHALQEGRFITVSEPKVAELRPLARSMNTMVQRLGTMFDAQAKQVESLRHLAQTDVLTGLRNRRQFMVEAQQWIESAGNDGVGLVLLRVLDLEGINRRLGHAATDVLLRSLAHTMVGEAEAQEQRLLGRLNGSDLALCVVGSGAVSDTATALLAALRQTLPHTQDQVAIVGGAVQVPAGTSLHHALALADQALARAEEQGPFSAATESCVESDRAMGEADWHKALARALAEGRIGLASYVVRNAQGALVQLDCPLRVQLEDGAPPVPASRWLALAARSRMTAVLDERALSLCLTEIARDGVDRCINLAAATLLASDSVAGLTARLAAAPGEAGHLWIDLPESVAVSNPSVVQDLTRRWRALGVRVGLEHAGAALSSIGRLYELGLHYVRIDGRFLSGIGKDEALRRHTEGLVVLLKGIGLAVFAEAVHDKADLRALWQMGFDGATGPAIDDQ